MSERELSEQIVEHGRSLYNRGLIPGSSGNISVRLPNGILITPTNSCLGTLDPESISRLDSIGNLIGGMPPSKEAFLHLAYYRVLEKERAVVHLHSTHSVAVSCLREIDPTNVLPPITAYFVLHLGRLPLVTYFAPGNLHLADAVAQAVRSAKGALLANHGPVIGGNDLDNAVYAAEEIEETAELLLLLRNQATQFLSDPQVRQLEERFPL
jgi:3-dehydro-4-phosphotetronate decarboxylase